MAAKPTQARAGKPAWEQDEDSEQLEGGKSNQVLVGCKLPQGLHIHINETRVTLNGTNSSRIIGGYGLTRVDESFMEQWLKLHADTRAVRNGLIFVQSNVKDAEAEARDNAENKNGMEGVDFNKPVPDVEGLGKPGKVQE